jgi:hypothetical protein
VTSDVNKGRNHMENMTSMDKEKLHYSDDSMEGQKIYSNLHITPPTKPLDLESFQLGLHLLEKEMVGKFAQELSNRGSRVEAQS